MPIHLNIKARAQELGFDLCGITSAAASEHADYFGEWIADGQQGEMGWLAREPERRSDPRRVLDDARSIIFLGMNYYQSSPPLRGRVARYALGEDYHLIFAEKLSVFVEELKKNYGHQHRFYADTGPVLEKPLAQRAGIGWQGKSTMLINRHYGPWLLLGEILTTLELEPDAPAQDHCGSCTRCIDVCPTRAITAPYQLDARLCIAYLTIELKGSIPVELRPLIGNRIFGCDECLDVCPWNRFARQASETRFHAAQNWDLHELLQLTDAEFKGRFETSPISRVKRRGLARNICVALGNIGTEDDLPALQRALEDGEPLVREHAQWAIEQIEARLKKSPELLPEQFVG
jgi:epoxyqueuosine reductase